VKLDAIPSAHDHSAMYKRIGMDFSTKWWSNNRLAACEFILAAATRSHLFDVAGLPIREPCGGNLTPYAVPRHVLRDAPPENSAPLP
jgi:hypothetical protein